MMMATTAGRHRVEPPRARQPADTIPALRALPAHLRAALPATPNTLQREAFPVILTHTRDNVVISAPTGAGKSATLHCALVAALASAATTNTPVVAVYVCPSRALCQLQAEGFKSRFGTRLGVRVVVRTGDDEDDVSLAALFSRPTPTQQPHTLLCTTPEKLSLIHI